MLTTIKLNKSAWEFDDSKPLGPAGGFGCVYASPSGVAVKKLNVKAGAAKRELTLAETLAEQEYSHVVPVLDAGEDAESGGFFVVMARCDESLQEYLNGKLPLTYKEAIAVLRDIATGLSQVGNIVHRDLKPGNVLKHEGRWKIADFGIARFVEDTTSLNTLRECLTPPFAAPEQWRNERASKATDVYALGCIAHVLLSGSPAFDAKELTAWQEAHVNSNPKQLPDTVPAKLRSLISLMLRKAPEVRPSIARIIETFDSVVREVTASRSAGSSLLASVDATISNERAKAEAEKQAADSEIKRNMTIAREAAQELYRLRNDFFKRISAEAANAKVNGWDISLGTATLSIRQPDMSFNSGNACRVGRWTVFNASSLSVEQRAGRIYRWGASLWFGTDGSVDELRWYELSFMDSPLTHSRRNHEPFAADPNTPVAQAAFSAALGTAQEAQRAVPIDGEDFDAFMDKWIERFGLAASGRLEKPRMLPLP